MRYLSFYLILMVLIGTSCQQKDENLIVQLMEEKKDLFKTVLDDPDKYEVQILYTQIDRDSNNIPYFNTHAYRVDSFKYFYPASTVKMPIAFLALEKLNNLYKYSQKPVDKYTPMRIGKGHEPQTSVDVDSTSPTGLPHIAHYVKKIFVVSDNDAYNRLYEFLGQDYINNTLTMGKGFKQTKLIHRLSLPGFSYEANRYTNPVELYRGDTILYEQKELYGVGGPDLPLQGTLKGKAFARYDDDEKETIVNQPFDFSKKNYMSIPDMQRMLYYVMFPQYIGQNDGFALTEDDYKFLYKVMSMRPRESKYPVYDAEHGYDGYCKFFMYGDTKENMPDNIRIFNKVGWAYGYLTDCAYIVDFENGVEFLLTATIHVNDNETYNDGKYEFEEIGLPFLANLGRVVYDYELKREKAIKPDLSWFKVDYTE